MTARVIPPHVHGQSSHYAKRYGCTDPACVHQASTERQGVRERRRAERRWIDNGDGTGYWWNHLVPRHGTAGGYQNYGCNCPCVPVDVLDGLPVYSTDPEQCRPGCGPAGRAAASNIDPADLGIHPCPPVAGPIHLPLEQPRDH